MWEKQTLFLVLVNIVKKVSTPMDPVEKLKPHTGKPVDQLEYSRAIGCLMYAMTSTRPDIAYAVGRLRMCLGFGYGRRGYGGRGRMRNSVFIGRWKDGRGRESLTSTTSIGAPMVDIEYGNFLSDDDCIAVT
ncbi:hypothetical protein Tco_0505716 [Tanacetum coccineum]